MQALWIKGGRVLDPATGTDACQDLFVCDGVVVDKATWDGACATAEVVEVDASGCYVMPGLIDLHVHLREPGFEYKETIETGTKAMAKGGFTGVCAMPNTKPTVDSVETAQYILNQAKAVSPIQVYPVAAVTKGQMGEELSDIEGMSKLGILAMSEDGKSVMNAALYREAMKLAKEKDMVVMAHCEDRNLVGKGALNAGAKADSLGVVGISNAVEDVIVARDILLAKETGARLHLCHCSTADSVAMIRAAKADGVRVTAEVCPHHFAMTEDEITGDDANYKMNPPLRSRRDVEALIAGLADGTMDAISTDHAPHSVEEKQRPIANAPFGIVGSETAVALTITHLVRPGYLKPLQMAERMSYAPAKILGIDRGSIATGCVADITVIDPECCYVIDKETFVSKGKNTPFHGHTVYGAVRFTIVGGKIVYEKE